jgi:hypothetical protein
MDGIRRAVNLRAGFFPITVAAVALSVCLSALPATAFQDEGDQAPPPTRPDPQQQEAASQDDSQDSSYQPLPSRLTLPAGTLVTVRVAQMLSSDRSVIGDTFTAELQQPLVVEGWVVARRGQTILGRVAVAQRAGRIRGTSQLGVELSSLVLVDGQQLPVRTQLQQASGGTSTGRDAQGIGTTTGLGTIIGAAAGDGKGAAIGAGAGAAAGIAGVLLTRGRPTIIPPESVLTFQLQSPLTFSTDRSRPAFRPVTQADYDNGSTLRRRPAQRSSARGPYPPPYWAYDPWGDYYPNSFYFGYYGFGRGFGHHRGFHR